MNNNFRFGILALFVYTIYFFFTSCANIGSITGGDKDSISPVMTGSNPQLADTGFKEKKVIIYFNEFFSLKDINQEFYASPPFKEIPDFKTRKRGLIVKFNEPLKDSVTYSLHFGNGITDFNEGNILKNFTFIFSTKSNVDSFSISGNLKKAIDQSSPEKSMVMLFDKNEDSIPYKSLPLYLSKTDSSGNFNINFIKPGSYKIFALNDKNNNQLADVFEDRAFLDSLIVPNRKGFFKIDSLKAGTILHDTINNITDSLENDTVIIVHKFTNSPSNLRLYMFPEINLTQKIVDFARQERGKFNIVLAIPITADFAMKPINFNISPDSLILEKNLNNDSITWWIADKSAQANDSLKVSFSFLSKDSLGNSFTKVDTLLFEFRPKVDKDAWKRKAKDDKVSKKEYLKINYLAKDKKVDLDKSLRIESPYPFKYIDTSKMKLFEIVDTSVIDTKEQVLLKAFRLQKDLLKFIFKRPIAEDFSIQPFNFKSENWFTSQASDSNRVYTCKIKDPVIADMDTLKLKIEFDNKFFLNQIQVLSDTAILPITKHKLLSRKRTDADKIILVFDKPQTTNLSVIPSDFTASTNWYRLSKNQNQDTVSIQITDKNVSNKDTLTFSVKCFDYIGLKGDSVYFNETMRTTFKEREQYLVSADWVKKEELKLIFNKKLNESAVIQPINFNRTKTWFNVNNNKDGDTIVYKITDTTVAAMDTIHFVLKFKDINRKGKTTDFADTILLPAHRFLQITNKTESGKTDKQKATPKIVHIYLPTDYKLLQDSLFIRQRFISKKWKENCKYLLRQDSMVYTNIFDAYNQAEDFEFSTPKLDYYSNIKLTLKNIKPNVILTLGNSLKQDSVENLNPSVSPFIIPQKDVDELIGEGKLIVQLLSDKNILIKEFKVSKEQDIMMDYLSPGKYKLKIIFDRNGNDKWDTGNYFKHLQPERVIINDGEIELKSGLEMELEWNVGESLIKSFTFEPADNIENEQEKANNKNE